MTRKPPQQPPAAPPAPPPDHLSARAAALWASVVAADTHPARAALIQTALEALDRADQARATLEREGLVLEPTRKTGFLHLHPCVKAEKDARQQFFAIWASLGTRAM